MATCTASQFFSFPHGSAHRLPHFPLGLPMPHSASVFHTALHSIPHRSTQPRFTHFHSFAQFCTQFLKWVLSQYLRRGLARLLSGPGKFLRVPAHFPPVSSTFPQIPQIPDVAFTWFPMPFPAAAYLAPRSFSQLTTAPRAATWLLSVPSRNFHAAPHHSTHLYSHFHRSSEYTHLQLHGALTWVPT